MDCLWIQQFIWGNLSSNSLKDRDLTFNSTRKKEWISLLSTSTNNLQNTKNMKRQFDVGSSEETVFSSRERFKCEVYLPIFSIIISALLVQLIKTLNNYRMVNPNDWWKNIIIIQKEHFRHPFGKQEYMYRNFSYTGIYIWNFILNKTNINIMSSYGLFKCCLKNFLFFNDITFRIF